MDDYKQQNNSKLITTQIETSDLVPQNAEYKNIQSSSLGVIAITVIVVVAVYSLFSKTRENSSYSESSSIDKQRYNAYPDESTEHNNYSETLSYGQPLSLARQEAQELVKKYSAAAAASGWVPHACIGLTPMQIKMCHDIAKCFYVTDYAVETVLGTVSATVAGHVAADTVLTYIPVLGWAAKTAIAGVVTLSLGSALIEYFEERSSLV